MVHKSLLGMRMVSKEEVAGFMRAYFPKCPLCGADKGYEVSGLAKNYVQCRSCGAKWQSTDFIECKELKEMQLWEPPYDGKGTSLKRKKYSIEFWQDSEAIETTSKMKVMESRAELIFHTEMTDIELETAIEKSLKEITRWDYGSTLYGKLGPLIDNMSFGDATIIRLLRAIFEQNKILIIQNELIRRAYARTKRG